MIISTTTIIIFTSTSTLTTIIGGIILCKSDIEKKIEIMKMRKKIKKLVDDIDDKDPNALHNLVCIAEPDFVAV